MKTKKCFKCGLEKPISEFYRHSRMADGYLNKCKECNKKDARETREKKLDYYRAYDRQRYHINGNRRKSIPYNEMYPDKAKAHTIVSNAIRDGRLNRPQTCSVCGCIGKKIEAHHSDYLKPLDVIWVCKECHWKIHKIINAMERHINASFVGETF